MAPNLSQRMTTPEYDVEVRTNDLGLRDDPIVKADGPRVLLLGDSFTFGYGVERGQIFADRLEESLGADVVNAGVGGFDVIHQLRWFRETGKTLDADLVVYALFLGNDLVGNGKWTERADGSLRHRDKTYPVQIRRSFKLRALLDVLLTPGPKAPKREWLPYRGYLRMVKTELPEDSRENYALTQDLLSELRSEVVASGAEFFVFLLPYKTMIDMESQARVREGMGLDDSYDFSRPATEMSGFLEANGITHFNFSGPMAEYYETGSDEPLYYFGDGHLTPRGHAFVASRLEPLLGSILSSKDAVAPPG